MAFIFDTSKGETPQSLARKRALIAQIMGQQAPTQARNAREGIGNAFSSIAGGISARVLGSQADKAEAAGTESANNTFNSLINGITGGMGTPSPIPMPGAAGEVAATSPSTGSGNYRDAIASIESAGSGDYAAVGPTHPKMGRALGRYQIMETNIGPWSQAALGRTVTPEEFMSSPELQDKIFDHQFGQYVQKYGPEGAAQAWLGGPGGVGKVNRKDVLGTSIGAYGQKFMNALGPNTEVASIDPSAGMGAAQAIDAAATPSGFVDPGVAAQPAQPTFDAGRFGPNINLAEMPPTRADITPQMQQQTAALSNQPSVPPLPVPTNVATPPSPPMQVAQAAPPQAVQPQPQQSGLSLQQLMAAASNPWLNEQQKGVVNMLIEQEMKRQDPSSQLDMQYRKAQIDALTAKANAGPDADEWGLNPVWGKDKDGKTVLGQVSKTGKFKPLDTGEFQPTPGLDKIDTGTDVITRNLKTGELISSTPKNNRQEAAEKAEGGVEGKTNAETKSEYDSITSKMPGLYSVVGRLEDLADKATYTAVGKGIDWLNTQTGRQPREGAVARAEYTAIVDNQILPLLRDTFGAQFTNEEGLRLAKTLGDADKSPTEKQALLRAFIQQKERDIQALRYRMDGSTPAKPEANSTPKQGARLRFNPQTGDFE